MPRGTPAQRLEAKLDNSITFVKDDGTTVAAQPAALDKGAVGVEIPGIGGARAEGLARLVMLADADVQRGYMFAIADGDSRYVRYRVLAANPPARGIERVCWVEVIDT